MSVPTEHQKLLNVSQSETPGQSSLPQTMNEVNELVQTFCSSGWSKGDIVTLHESEATVDAVLTALNSCSWVHLACHGFQDHAQPMKSAFALHDGHLELHIKEAVTWTVCFSISMSGCIWIKGSPWRGHASGWLTSIY
jgi:CHAT domain-containing protein